MNALALKLLVVALGGALGAILRFLAVRGAHALLGYGFPYGTLLVNVSGSLAIGYLLVILPETTDPMPLGRLLLVTGLLGGFTTFSAFSIETLQLMQAGQGGRALLNVLANVALCLAAAWGGFVLGRAIHGP